MKKQINKDFQRHVYEYITPNSWRSIAEILATILLLLLGLTTLNFAMKNSIWLLFMIIVISLSLLYSRLFILQHDLGHGNLFKNRKYNNAVGVIIGIILLTPYYFWRKAHAIHHVSGGNADRRPWIGDIDLLSVKEYRKKNWWEKLLYRLYRNPFIMFCFGSIYVFMIEHRFCRKRKGFGRKEAQSVLTTNIAIIILYGSIISLLGIKFYLLAILLPQWLGGVFGIYLFYIQHNFKNRYFVSAKYWNLQDSALLGSTFYDFPQPIRWLTANIGYHHIHTLMPRIPFYRLPQCHKENVFFHIAPTFRLKDMPKMISLKLYDEKNKKMITWKEYRKLR
ncbi:TPA: fatty acid desaturase [Legionella pneumophila]|uniref:fatty acid desaturase family protein n=1 Tax=Legionella pneumophila TaxID=446 RepID=UPI001374FEA8|nr:fatty acid desaturase [Legionella pneumophila]MCH9145147.1 fatty acid desaturase [Legionella pneumophila serogroup 1]MDW9167186.1 fatty acid desaturase [Legionella pneumophila subsp. fraseri]HCC3265140.1 fatty acid desaturase [Legionella pneumophila subsp. pneumophila]MCZ4680414.1 fatty acid desaturase [Legionella pneumophila]MCZ4738644.1 fatty acid desaturase [Legionella pneumophila]